MQTVMRLISFIFSLTFVATAADAEVFNYSCKLCIFPPTAIGDGCDVADGKVYALRIDESKNLLEWRGQRYALTEQPKCANYGWHAESKGKSFDFCTATQGYGAIENKDEVRARCDLKK